MANKSLTPIICALVGLSALGLGYWLSSYWYLRPLHIILAISTSMIWILLPPTFLRNNAGPTYSEFLSSLKHVESSTDECIICRDICTSPVLLSCGHTECEPCLLLWFDDQEQCRCPHCSTELFCLGNCWSALRCKATVCAAAITAICTLRYKATVLLVTVTAMGRACLLGGEFPGGVLYIFYSLTTGVWFLFMIMLSLGFISAGFDAYSWNGSDWWRSFGSEPREEIFWLSFLVINAIWVLW